MLQIRDLTKSYPRPGDAPLVVLDVPAFDIAKGQQVALVGNSGGGKTTLLHIIAGLTTPSSGTVNVGGVELTRLSEPGRDRVRADKIGYVFQTFNLLPAFSAIENVLLGMSFGRRKVDQSRAAELLDRVGLTDRADHRPAQLSVGQQQRVAIARALAGRPQLLLADEPTANVDPRSSQTVLQLILDACGDDEISLLMVTHDHEAAGRLPTVVDLDQLNRALFDSPDS